MIYYDVTDPYWGDELIAKVAENVASALSNPKEGHPAPRRVENVREVSRGGYFNATSHVRKVMTELEPEKAADSAADLSGQHQKSLRHDIVVGLVSGVLGVLIASFTTCYTQRTARKIEMARLQAEHDKILSDSDNLQLRLAQEQRLKEAELRLESELEEKRQRSLSEKARADVEGLRMQLAQQQQSLQIQLDQQAKAREEQLRDQELTDEKKTRVVREQLELERLETHDETVRNLLSTTQSTQSFKGTGKALNSPRYYTLKVINHCDNTAAIALRYAAVDGLTEATGWYNLKPNEEQTLAYMSGAWFGYYGYSGNTRWEGDEEHDVTDKAFTYIDDQYYRAGWLHLPGNVRSVRFINVRFDVDPYELSLTCSK